MLKGADPSDVIKAMQRGGNSMLINAFMNMHGEFAEAVMAIVDTRHSFSKKDWINLFAAVNGDPDMVKLLAGSGEPLTEGEQQRILHAAACPANLDTIKTLVELGVDIKAASDERGLTAMHYAARVPNIEMLQYLKQMGLDIDRAAKRPHHIIRGAWAPVQEAAAFGPVENIRWFKRVGAIMRGDHLQLMHVAANHGRMEVIKYLQEIGESLSVRGFQGATPLHSAASSGHVGVVRYLVEKGVDVNAQADEGSTPLHLATALNQREVVRVLSRELGASLSLMNKSGLTAFDLAMMTPDLQELAEVLETPRLPARPPPPPWRSIFSSKNFPG